MRLYESVVILNPHNTEEQMRGCVTKLEEIFKKYDAKLVNRVDWGRRPLGFSVQKLSEGFYMLVDFEANPAKLAEIQNAFRLADFILFSSTFVKGKSTAAPQQKISA